MTGTGADYRRNGDGEREPAFAVRSVSAQIFLDVHPPGCIQVGLGE